MTPWMDFWNVYIGGTFLQAYLERLGDSRIIPGAREDLATMMRAFLLEKAVYELGYELNNRPRWLPIPISGIETLLQDEPDR